MCATDCVLVGLDWDELMMLFVLHVTCSCISHAYVLSFQYILIYLNYIWDFSDCLSLLLSSICISLCLWHLNASLLHPRTLFVLGHPLHLILLLHLFGSMMRMPEKSSRRTFLDEAFILNTKSSERTLPTLTYPMSGLGVTL